LQPDQFTTDLPEEHGVVAQQDFSVFCPKSSGSTIYGAHVGIALDDADGHKQTTVRVLQHGYVWLPWAKFDKGNTAPGMAIGPEGAGIYSMTYSDPQKGKEGLAYVNIPSIEDAAARNGLAFC
jgi:hypothetical protein